MHAADLAVIAAYLGLVLLVNRYWAGKVDFDGWLTSKNTIGLWFLVFTVVSTNVGAGTIVGTVGKTMRTGSGWALTSGVGVMFGFWIMAAIAGRIRKITPQGDRSSFSEFFRRRYSRRVGMAVGGLIALLYFFYLAAQFKALGAMLEVWGGWDARAAGLAAALLVIWMTAGAGIRSDMYTDVIHFWAMVVTIFAAAALEVRHQGGLGTLFSGLSAQGKLAGLLDPYRFGGRSYVWVGIPVGALLGLPAFENWQRVDAALHTRAAGRAFWLSGALNLLFFGAAMFLGFVAAAAVPADTPSNHVLYELIRKTLPPGLLGLAVVGIFAAVMSTANTMLMVSVAALLGDLLYVGSRSLRRERAILRTTRLVTWGVGAAALLIAAARPDIIDLVMTGLWGSGMLLPAIIGGLYWRRANSRAALWSSVLGFVLTFALSYVRGWEENSWIPGLALSAALFVGLSFLTGHDRGENLRLAG